MLNLSFFSCTEAYTILLPQSMLINIIILLVSFHLFLSIMSMNAIDSLCCLGCKKMVFLCHFLDINKLFKFKYFHLLILFLFFMVSFIFKIVFNQIGSSSSQWFQYNLHNSTVHHIINVFNFRVFFKDFVCCKYFS